ncbi:TIGR01841 family phasin [Sphingomonas sp. AOB5]|uniref:phasin family protein n=1 Tax=Sphingomonas sp. AOB5 TaxID=3034017 RepID=UPI0023F7F2D1|nr:TIGR01841 family phasin [Sphingomonas sp. AOB5]MDF7776602.1 TIGR01841 family phasin [Sphingomonas sp. AOB5]
MASKGSSKSTGKPAAPKVPARPKVAPKPKVAAVAAEKKPAPVIEAAPVAPPAVIEPVAAVEAAPQEVSVPVEAPVETAEAVVETVETAVEAVSETVTEAVETVVPAAVKDTKIMETIESNVAKAQAFFADFNDRAKAAVEKSTKLAEEANEFAKGNVEALVESGKITAKGFESFGQEAADYSRKSFEAATAALKSMSAVKSPTELFKLQSDFFRTSFDSYVAEASKTTEALIKLAGDAAQPLSSRVALAAEKAKLAA